MIQLDTRYMKNKFKQHAEENGDEIIEITSRYFTLSAQSKDTGVEWKCYSSNSGCEEFENFLSNNKLTLEDISILGTILEMELSDIYQLLDDLNAELMLDCPSIEDCQPSKVRQLSSEIETIYMTYRMFKKLLGTIRCSQCGKVLTEGDLILQHEYGSFYCSYKCLCLGGFALHWKQRSMDEAIADNKLEML